MCYLIALDTGLPPDPSLERLCSTVICLPCLPCLSTPKKCSTEQKCQTMDFPWKGLAPLNMIADVVVKWNVIWSQRQVFYSENRTLYHCFGVWLSVSLNLFSKGCCVIDCSRILQKLKSYVAASENSNLPDLKPRKTTLHGNMVIEVIWEKSSYLFSKTCSKIVLFSFPERVSISSYSVLSGPLQFDSPKRSEHWA